MGTPPGRFLGDYAFTAKLLGIPGTDEHLAAGPAVTKLTAEGVSSLVGTRRGFYGKFCPTLRREEFGVNPPIGSTCSRHISRSVVEGCYFRLFDNDIAIFVKRFRTFLSLLV